MTKKPILLGFFLIMSCVFLDQLTKWYVITELMNPPQVIPVTSFFSYVLAWNKGVSFSMFNSYGVTGTYVLIALSFCISVFFLAWLFKAKNYWLASGLGFIIGGAIGNIIDRVRFGAVIDFLHFYYESFSWPAFNLADTFITIGVILIFIESFLSYQGEKKCRK